MSFKLSARSLKSLEGVHPDLVTVVKRAIRITPIDFVVIEGLRTEARQRELYRAGASRTMNSRHLTGHAVDLAVWLGTVRWEQALYDQLAPAVKQAATELGVSIQWGYDLWGWDSPHWQLSRHKYRG
jgi:peptidoglycan L-alanyl-D-glutamate endopeptidase CwlK